MERKRSILVVDDEEMIRESLHIILKKKYIVDMAENGKNALEMFRESEYDLVIMDWSMPGLDGGRTLEEMKKIKPSTKCIFLTAHADFTLAAKVGRMGALDFIVKPPDRNELLKRIDKIMQEHEEGEQFRQQILMYYPQPITELFIKLEEAPNTPAETEKRRAHLHNLHNGLLLLLVNLSIAKYIYDGAKDYKLNEDLLSQLKCLYMGCPIYQWNEVLRMILDYYADRGEVLFSPFFEEKYAIPSEEFVKTIEWSNYVSAALGRDEKFSTSTIYNFFYKMKTYFEFLPFNRKIQEFESLKLLESALLEILNFSSFLMDCSLIFITSLYGSEGIFEYKIKNLQGVVGTGKTFTSKNLLHTGRLYLLVRKFNAIIPLYPVFIYKKCSYPDCEYGEKENVFHLSSVEPEPQYESLTCGHRITEPLAKEEIEIAYKKLESPRQKYERLTQEVTILFADVVGSTKYYEDYGDIRGRQMVEKVVSVVSEIIHKNDGEVIKTIGDEVMARFVQPGQAVLAGCQILQNFSQFNQECRENPEKEDSLGEIHLRIAINCGKGIVEEKDVFGDVVNVCARIRGAIDPDTIGISKSVYIKTQFSTAEIKGTVQVKGKEEPIAIYQINKW